METIIKERNKNYKIDLTNRRITFLDSRWYYCESGKPVPSVTTILDAYPKGPAYYEWLKRMGSDADDIRDEAGLKGSSVHGMTEKYDNGLEVSLLTESGDINMSLMEWGMFERYVEFRRRFAFEIIDIERTLISEKLGYAGTLDRVIEMNGKKILLDIKTSSAIHPHYWLQLSAYENLLTDAHGYNPVDASAILWLNAKTKTEGKKGTIQGQGWQLVFMPETDEDKNKELFKNVHALWLAEHGDSEPRQVSYSLTHKKADVMLAEYKQNDKVTIIS
jgi:hypothetical protein